MPTILVVDDDPLILELLGHILTESGYAVVLANDGNNAIALYDPLVIDAVVTDVQMPGLDGIQVTQELRMRAQAAGRELPVWLITGNPSTDLQRRAAGVGAVTVLSKPLTVDKIRLELKARLGS